MKKSIATIAYEMALDELRRCPDPVKAAHEMYARERDGLSSVESGARLRAAVQIMSTAKPVPFSERALGNE